MRDLRHAVLTDHDTRPAHGQITTAVAELAQQLNGEPATESTTDPPVTKHVTKSVVLPSTAHQPPPNPADTPPSRAVRTVDLTNRIGPGWTLVQHEGETDAVVWHVHHDGHAVGTIRRAYDLATNTRGWEARTAGFDHVRAVGSFAANRRTDRLWRTRDSAAAGIAAHTTRHAPTPAARHRRRPG